MSSSYPSRAAFVFDVPEPSGLNAKFLYRYFLKNEKASIDSFGSEESFRRHGNKPAREILLSYEAARESIGVGTGDSSLGFTEAEKSKIFTENLDNLVSELSVGSRSFTTVLLQDKHANAALQLAVENSLRVHKKKTKGLSPIQKVLNYGSISQELDAQSVLDYTDIDAANEYTTFDPKTGQIISKTGEGDVGKLSFSASINNKFLEDLVSKSKTAALSPIFDAIDAISAESQRITQRSASSDPSKIVEIDDYEPSAVPVSSTVVDVDTASVYGNVLLGYLIQKYEVGSDGSITFIDRFTITNPRQTKHSDYAVVYGKRYQYSIQSVYLVRILSYDGSNFVSCDYLMTSRESPTIEVLCEEAKPPPPPVDIRFWLSQERKFHIEWQHPFNKQEDIKRYQVFRRRSINEPFQLLAELDFDDSEVKTPKSDNLIPSSVLFSNFPVGSYIDELFDLDGSYIYAVCSIDARDLSSGYSEQFSVRFERQYGKLRIDRVSAAGAPKPYPNFMLDRPVTIDSMKVSGFKKASVYFDPDYLKVLDLREKDLRHLATSNESPSYSIQFINIDLQQDAKVSISIVDNRQS